MSSDTPGHAGIARAALLFLASADFGKVCHMATFGDTPRPTWVELGLAGAWCLHWSEPTVRTGSGEPLRPDGVRSRGPRSVAVELAGSRADIMERVCAAAGILPTHAEEAAP